MGKCWLDADAMIQAHNGLFSLEIARPFWDFLEAQAKAGKLCSSVKVYSEILSYEDKADPLLLWAKSRRHSGLFCEPEKIVQEAYTKVANYVAEHYDQRPVKVGEFLKGGDGWIIAHAMCDGGIVVSHEARLDSGALTPKIPNVCHNFGVGCITLPAMLTRFNFKFGK